MQYISNIIANLLFYHQLKKQSFKIQSITMQNDINLFKIINLQKQIFKIISSSSDIYPINNITNPLILTAKAKKPTKKPAKNADEAIIANIKLIYKFIKI